MSEQIKDAVRSALADVPLPEPTVPPLPWYRKVHILFLVRWLAWRESRLKHFWVCHGYKNGAGIGHLHTPRPMTEAQAVKWLRDTTEGTITFIDRTVGFIFYKPKD
jgi:hypothetical protein